MTLDLELVIICTDKVFFFYCCYVYNYPMQDRVSCVCSLTTVYCHVGGNIRKFKFCAIVVTS